MSENKLKAYFGCDPGAKGSICLLVPEHTENNIIFADTTTSPDQLYEALKLSAQEFTLAPIMIENVSSIPGASAGSNFKFGYNVGMLQGIIQSTAIGMDTVRPKAWQKELGIAAKFKGKDIKKEVARLIKQIYPTASIHGPKGGLLDGRADALAIAHHCMLKYN